MKLRLTIIGLLVLLSVFAPAAAEAHPANGIVADRAGNVYFSDLETIWKLDTERRLTVFRAGVPGRHVHELSIDEHDNVYGADVSYNQTTKGWPSNVWRMTPEGQFTYLLETTENPPRGWSIWRDRAGNMYSIEQNNHTKTQTLLLRRSPDGSVEIHAGGAYGHADGKGSMARFGSVGGIAFGPDGTLYLADGAFLRKVTMDGNVSTLAADLTRPGSEDSQRLFGGKYGSLAGLAVDSAGYVYLADSGNRRVLKVDKEGKVQVVLRSEPPFFPTGAVAAGNDVFVLEVGFTLPNLSSGPRIRKLGPGGEIAHLATVGAQDPGAESRPSLLTKAGTSAESTLAFLVNDDRMKYSMTAIGVAIISAAAFFWRRRRRMRA